MFLKFDPKKIRIFYFTCNFLAILPPHEFGKKARKPSRTFKIYTIFQIMFYLALFAYSAYGRELYIYKQLNGVVTITSRICSLSLTLLNVFMRVHMIFLNGYNFQKFMNSIDDLSRLAPFKKTPNRLMQLQFGIFNLYLISLIGCDYYVWITSLGPKVFQFFCLEDLLFYNINTIISFAIYAATQIKHFYISLNKLLTVTCKTLACSDSDIRFGYVLKEFNSKAYSPNSSKNINNEYLANIRRYYNAICDFVDLFNNIYGLIILFSILSIISFTTNQVDILIAYALQGSNNKLMAERDALQLAVISVLWVITLFIMSTLLAYSCASAISEREKMATICLFWFNQISSTSPTEKEKMFKGELQVLIQQLEVRKPKFSAAGFFPVDFTLLGFIIGSVTSYIIVSIQFI